ncbi:hypothetical protein CRENBAI_018286 [Crenichthys baileyi]|uniref:Uncharacterized protein n=1 Tax=Crenichthys baileyi TaxID=28760 RepID=A0AAV9RQW3_9TELE
MEPSILQLNFDVQPCHVRLQSDEMAAPHVVCDGSLPSFLLTCSQKHSPGLHHSQSKPCCKSPGSDLDSSHLAQLSALLPQHDSLTPPPPPSTSTGRALKSFCQASPRLTSSTLAPALFLNLLFFIHIVHGFSPALHSSHSTSPEFASNLATSASSSLLYRHPAHSSAPPTGIHLANARPCLCLVASPFSYVLDFAIIAVAIVNIKVPTASAAIVFPLIVDFLLLVFLIVFVIIAVTTATTTAAATIIMVIIFFIVLVIVLLLVLLAVRVFPSFCSMSSAFVFVAPRPFTLSFSSSSSSSDLVELHLVFRHVQVSLASGYTRVPWKVDGEGEWEDRDKQTEGEEKEEKMEEEEEKTEEEEDDNNEDEDDWDDEGYEAEWVKEKEWDSEVYKKGKKKEKDKDKHEPCEDGRDHHNDKGYQEKVEVGKKRKKDERDEGKDDQDHDERGSEETELEKDGNTDEDERYHEV